MSLFGIELFCGELISDGGSTLVVFVSGCCPCSYF